jgi:MFS family permease
MLHNFSSAVRLAIFFPYIRTTVSCSTPVDPQIPNSSSDWSGSLHCGDKDYVARVGQERLGFAMGTNLILQFLFISMLGSAADSYGRKPVLAISWLGYLIEWYY